MTATHHEVMDERLSLSASLRRQTQRVHDHAENSAYLKALLAGTLPLDAYTALVAQNLAIYTALEDVSENWRDDPVAGSFVIEALVRVPRLQTDLAMLTGENWLDKAAELRAPATERYVHRLYDEAGDDAEAFIAHHYVRYLGDLSGGQIICSSLKRIYGDRAHGSTAFYSFDRIAKIKEFRDDYRARLDTAPLTHEQRRRLVAEAVVAFELNRAVFADLATKFLPNDGVLLDPATKAIGGDETA
jgi:heme oxygenase (biliverdin-producing, ferredoxin)